jgi:hypothetical protein
MMRTALLCTAAALFCGFAVAQDQTTPAPVLRIYVEHVKPGKSSAHEKSESAFARTMKKVNYPAHYLALNSMAGAYEAWFVEEHSSFAEVEKSDQFGEAPGVKADMDLASALDGEVLTSMRSLIGVYRPDLSYHAEQGMKNLPKARYFNVVTVRIKAGAEPKLIATLKQLFDLYASSAFEQPAIVYQLISGTQSGSYLIFEPMASLAEWDKVPAMMKTMRDVGGKRMDQILAGFSDITVFEEPRLMSVSQKMSYVSKEFAGTDPDFWTPKPPAAKPAAKKRAAPKQTGQ